jgi:AraC-like DNA-binding protein
LSNEPAELQAGCPAGRLYGESLATALALHLLAETRLSLAEISCRLGFSSPTQVTTMFRKQVGTTPGAYRQAL